MMFNPTTKTKTNLNEPEIERQQIQRQPTTTMGIKWCEKGMINDDMHLKERTTNESSESMITPDSTLASRSNTLA
jgi:hypothetical protein